MVDRVEDRVETPIEKRVEAALTKLGFSPPVVGMTLLEVMSLIASALEAMVERKSAGRG